MPGATIENLGGSALAGLVPALLITKTQRTRMRRRAQGRLTHSVRASAATATARRNAALMTLQRPWRRLS